jgi:hypothetical protein
MPDSDHTDPREDSRFTALQADLAEAFDKLVFDFQFDGLGRDAAMVEVCALLKRLVRSVPGPTFDHDGYIPAAQSCTEAVLARWFGANPHRRELMERIRDWLRLARAVRARRVLLDGSFVTAKEQPGDVDAVVLLPEDFRDQLRDGSHEAARLYEMIVTREPRELFAAEDDEDWWGWFEFFSRTREANGRRKGLVEVVL